MIRIEGVSKRFDETIAVDGMTLEVGAQKLYGLIGPNGAGKTTTLKMLATLIKPDSGTVTVAGMQLSRDTRGIRRQIGYMPDSFGTFRGMTCGEYLQFFGNCHGLRGRELVQRIDDVLALTDLGPRRDELASGLSMGLRQRLSLAKTLLHDPRVLLLDEPASGLDPRARIEIRVFLKELARMGKTIVISSHILADLEDICTDVAIIEHGRLVWDGPLAAVTAAGADDSVVLELEVPEAQRDAARALLEKVERVVAVEVVDERLQVHTATEANNALLRVLLDAEIQVLHFTRKVRRLEDLFLDQTKGLAGG
ncbi:MAG: ABC transporter ATP-binding protein [Planctomycetes bacterium]|nr:ABC transporter ATP-binding protein [Planctomycetota bacterium]MCB9870377.1 ABC transporter ATP-binding protein [Planctomycetota bacterium]